MKSDLKVYDTQSVLGEKLQNWVQICTMGAKICGNGCWHLGYLQSGNNVVTLGMGWSDVWYFC